MSSEDLFVSYQPRIRRYIMGMVHDPTDADDLTQEVFLQAHRKLDSVRDPDALRSWLYRIATHVCYDHFRRSSRQPRLEPLDVDGSAEAAPAGDEADDARLDRVIERSEMSACVRRFLEDLPDEYRHVILLHDLEGLKNTEIAEVLGTSVARSRSGSIVPGESYGPRWRTAASSPMTSTTYSSVSPQPPTLRGIPSSDRRAKAPGVPILTATSS